jgi:hypothetical protein
MFGQVSYGQQKNPPSTTATASCATRAGGALSATAAYKVTPRLEGMLRADYVNNKKNGGGLLGYSYDDGINGIGRGWLADGSFRQG